jgi:hypothetical protein
MFFLKCNGVIWKRSKAHCVRDGETLHFDKMHVPIHCFAILRCWLCFEMGINGPPLFLVMQNSLFIEFKGLLWTITTAQVSRWIWENWLELKCRDKLTPILGAGMLHIFFLQNLASLCLDICSTEDYPTGFIRATTTSHQEEVFSHFLCSSYCIKNAIFEWGEEPGNSQKSKFLTQKVHVSLTRNTFWCNKCIRC